MEEPMKLTPDERKAKLTKLLTAYGFASFDDLLKWTPILGPVD